ncbi:MAG: DUF4863 family protein [Alphaproteobacteria bacterium]|nr:DUF4863 family protein [Alphaproteobacteria bacterium]
MPDKSDLIDALAPILDVVREVDPADPDAAATLNARLPLHAEPVQRVAALMRQGVEEGWLCEREAGPVRYSRLTKADHPATAPLSIDLVHMATPGPGHLHPQGEMDLCLPVDGEPRFDGNPPGWTVYPPGSWHVPTVRGGRMDILYFLPGGAIRFGPRPGAEG